MTKEWQLRGGRDIEKKRKKKQKKQKNKMKDDLAS